MRTFSLSRFRAFPLTDNPEIKLVNIKIKLPHSRIDAIKFLRDSWFISAEDNSSAKTMLDEILVNGIIIDEIYLEEFESVFNFTTEKSDQRIKNEEEKERIEKANKDAYEWLNSLSDLEKDYVKLIIQNSSPVCTG